MVVGRISGFLEEVLPKLEPIVGDGKRGRPRVVPSVALWSGMLLCVVEGFTGMRSVWRLISQSGLWRYPRFPVTDQAIYKRLAAEGAAPMRQLFVDITKVLAERLTPLLAEAPPVCGFASAVVALDESTLDKMARHLPALREVPTRKRLGGGMAGLYDVRAQQWLRVEYHPADRSNEKLRAREMVAGLPKGALILADLGYFGFEWFDYLSDHGYHFISRLRAKTTYKVRHVLVDRECYYDAIVELGAYRADRARHLVRLVHLKVGEKEFRYLTNVLDPQVLSAQDLVRAYARRWDFELAMQLVKRELKLHLIWSGKEEPVQAQLWAALTIGQILQALRWEVAIRADVDVFDVSMKLLIQWMPVFAAKGIDPVEAFVRQGREAEFIRPSTRKHYTVDLAGVVYNLPPKDLLLTRKPRYAHRKCGPRVTELN